jgi:hypothetical protein
VAVKEILSSPNVKRNKVLLPARAKIVKQFNCIWWNQQVMSGTKDYISVTQKARRFIFWNDYFCVTSKRSLLKFQGTESRKVARLLKVSRFTDKKTVCWLEQVVLNTVSACAINHHVNLMILGEKLYDLTQKQVKTYNNCLS